MTPGNFFWVLESPMGPPENITSRTAPSALSESPSRLDDSFRNTSPPDTEPIARNDIPSVGLGHGCKRNNHTGCNHDGVYEERFPFSISGNNITITMEGFPMTGTVVLSGNNLTITFTFMGETDIIRLQRQ